MSLAPLLDAARPIPSHAIIALLAAVLGLWQMVGAKGTARHRIVGWLFVLGMAYVALSAVFISTIKLWGAFSPIHLLIPVTLYSLWVGVRRARAGDIAGHKRTMVSLFVMAVLITGAFTLLPGRVMHETLFGPSSYGDTR